jgi:hypothetical protein
MTEVTDYPITLPFSFDGNPLECEVQPTHLQMARYNILSWMLFHLQEEQFGVSPRVLMERG